jgi:DNA-binding transcriptional LysR family regulator
LQGRYHGIAFELVPEYREVSLAMREADVAVRLLPSSQHDLVVRTIGRLAFGLYVSHAYAAGNGLPDPAAACSGHSLLCLEGGERTVHAGWLQTMTAAAEPGLRLHSHEALLCAARAGGGIACLSRYRADGEPELQRLPTPIQPPTSDISLAVHKDSRHTPRIRITLDAIADTVKAAAERLNPPDAAAEG